MSSGRTHLARDQPFEGLASRIILALNLGIHVGTGTPPFLNHSARYCKGYFPDPAQISPVVQISEEGKQKTEIIEHAHDR